MSKWFEDLNIEPDILNLIEHKLANGLEFISTGNNFLSWSLIVQAQRKLFFQTFILFLNPLVLCDLPSLEKDGFYTNSRSIF